MERSPEMHWRLTDEEMPEQEYSVLARYDEDDGHYAYFIMSFDRSGLWSFSGGETTPMPPTWWTYASSRFSPDKEVVKT